MKDVSQEEWRDECPAPQNVFIVTCPNGAKMVTWCPSSICLIVEKKSQKRRRMTAADSCPTMDNIQVCPCPDETTLPPLQTHEDPPDGRSLDTFSLWFLPFLKKLQLVTFSGSSSSSSSQSRVRLVFDGRWSASSGERTSVFALIRAARALISELTYIFCRIFLLNLFKSDIDDCKSTTATGSRYLQTKLGHRLSCSLSTVISLRTLGPAVVTHLQCSSTSWTPGDPSVQPWFWLIFRFSERLCGLCCQQLPGMFVMKLLAYEL